MSEEQKVCSVEDCENKHYSRTYCKKHYQNLMRCGNPLGLRSEPKPLCECGKIAVARGMCKAHYSSWWYHHRQGSDDHRVSPELRHDMVGFSGAHTRIRAVRGHAKSYDCVVCGFEAQEWALSAEATDLLFETDKRGNEQAYSLNVYNYLPMCQADHKAYDAQHGNRNYKLQESRWDK